MNDATYNYEDKENLN